MFSGSIPALIARHHRHRLGPKLALEIGRLALPRCHALRCRSRPWKSQARSASPRKRSARATSPASSMSISRSTWKFPSPTWPTNRRDETHLGGLFLRGPSRNRPAARPARRHPSKSPWPRDAAQGSPSRRHAAPARGRPRSSSRVVNAKPVPPCSPAISPKTSACSATLASEPWNSSRSMGASVSASFE